MSETWPCRKTTLTLSSRTDDVSLRRTLPLFALSDGKKREVNREKEQGKHDRKSNRKRAGERCEHPIFQVAENQPGPHHDVPTVPTQKAAGVNANSTKERHSGNEYPSGGAIKPPLNATLHGPKRKETQHKAG